MKEYFNKLICERQSCRDFNDKHLDKEVLLEIARQSLLAPSACNSQPWKMYLVSSCDKVELVKEALQYQGHNLFTAKAQAFIVVAETGAKLKSFVGGKFNSDYFVKYDIGELVAYITLTAASMGVSSCILGWMDNEKLRTAVKLPDDETCSIVVALGYSDADIRDKIRKPVEDVIVEV